MYNALISFGIIRCARDLPVRLGKFGDRTVQTWIELSDLQIGQVNSGSYRGIVIVNLCNLLSIVSDVMKVLLYNIQISQLT